MCKCVPGGHAFPSAPSASGLSSLHFDLAAWNPPLRKDTGVGGEKFPHPASNVCLAFVRHARPGPCNFMTN